MVTQPLKYPIGIQSFKELRESGYVYVDKTAFVHQLISTGKYYFLRRPRRFGKSLMLSTLDAYFRGKKHLFEGLDIDSIESDWLEYPVIHIDMNVGTYSSIASLTDSLRITMGRIADEYGVTIDSGQFVELQFNDLIIKLSKNGAQCGDTHR